MIKPQYQVKGQATTEYTLVFGLITFICVYLMINVGGTMKEIFLKISASCDGASNKTTTASPVSSDANN